MGVCIRHLSRKINRRFFATFSIFIETHTHTYSHVQTHTHAHTQTHTHAYTPPAPLSVGLTIPNIVSMRKPFEILFRGFSSDSGDTPFFQRKNFPTRFFSFSQEENTPPEIPRQPQLLDIVNLQLNGTLTLWAPLTFVVKFPWFSRRFFWKCSCFPSTFFRFFQTKVFPQNT